MSTESLPVPKIHLPGDNYLLFDVSGSTFDLLVQHRLIELSNGFAKVLRGVDAVELGNNVMTIRFDSLIISPLRLAEGLRTTWSCSAA